MAKFCGNCGQTVDAKTGLCPQCDQVILTKKKKRIKSVRVVVAVLCCISVIAVGIFGALKLFNKDTASHKYSEHDSFEEDFTDAVLSPKSAVDIYMANKIVWMENPEYTPMQGYGYCLLDLDFDGVLELISSINDGSGRYSYNKFYRINIDELTVEEFRPQSDQQEGDMNGIDYYFLDHQSKLLKNKSTGNLFYLFEDYLRVSTDEGVEIFAEVYMKDNMFYENPLFSEYWHPDYDNNTTNEIREYYFKDVDVSKSEYEQKTNTFYGENKDMNLVWKCILGSEFDKGNDSTQRQLLLDAYRLYSYDGFSYDKVETYDVDIKQTIRVENNMQLTLTGTITEEAYEINPQNKGEVFILNLDEPIKCVIYDEFMGYNGEEKNIDSVQINIFRGEYEYYKGETVTLTGSVIIAHTGHHLRDIVLEDCVFK